MVKNRFDAVVVGAGFAGMYMLHQLRSKGFNAHVYEAGDGVGGVWYWNRYPGARCDVESIYYNYTFSKELYEEWSWKSRFPEQPEILSYLNHVADRFKLRKDITFGTRVNEAMYIEDENLWRIQLSSGEIVWANYFITGVGCLSAANFPKFAGLETFKGESYHTGHWPKESVDFQGKKVAVIGTGSSGIQSIPVIAEQASHLYVFQRTPQYTVPARNYVYEESFIRETKDKFVELKRTMRSSPVGSPFNPNPKAAIEDIESDRIRNYEEAWDKGAFAFSQSYYDLLLNEDSNETASEFIRGKIRETVKNPEVAELLCPKYPFGTKRQILDTNYYETYNRENVSLIDIKRSPIKQITETGIQTESDLFDVDIIVFATGYDGMTGPLFKFDIRGKSGLLLRDKWENGGNVRTYLGITTAEFPNMFMITGPESPSVLVNMPTAIEQHVEWIIDCLAFLRTKNIQVFENSHEAEQLWSKHCQDVAESTLYTKGNSWYTGANIDGKPRSFLIYLGGFDYYSKRCKEIVENNYEGFILS